MSFTKSARYFSLVSPSPTRRSHSQRGRSHLPLNLLELAAANEPLFGCLQYKLLYRALVSILNQASLLLFVLFYFIYLWKCAFAAV